MIEHILLDMGGVLIDLQWQDRVGKLLGRSLPIDELHHLWVSAPSTVDFESGRTDFDQFTAAFIQDFDLALTPEMVQHEFLEIVQAPLPGCEVMLSALKPQYHLSLLSNTNPAHFGKLRDRYDFFEALDRLFLSYEIGLMKPSPTIFEHVLAELDTTPEHVAFFDDGARNVESAKALGIQAYRVDSPAEIMTIVKTFSEASTT
ncbi:MAG: HAD family phosphatase [Leptolyngbya sp. LCM1.Bin17]|nr:MAG: HAD family phosphatase [Leptolyngbya sp. LCM1.Bin17]